MNFNRDDKLFSVFLLEIYVVNRIYKFRHNVDLYYK